MKFTQRLAYYFGGFGIGLIILVFFLNGKEASCDYGPNARVVKNISSKKILLTDTISEIINTHKLDTSIIKDIIKYGDVDFSRGNRELDSCKIYIIENIYKEQKIELEIENCNLKATVKNIKFIN